jgi:hypothetical protein
MTFFNAGDRIKVLDENITMSASYDGVPVDLASYEFGLFTFRWSGADATNGTVILQISDNAQPGTWEDYTGSSFTITSADGSHYWDVFLRSGWYYRMKYTPGGNTAGTYSTFVRAKVPV